MEHRVARRIFLILTLFAILALSFVQNIAPARGGLIPNAGVTQYLPIISKPLELTVLNNHSSFVTSWGSLHILGEISNNSQNTYSAISLGTNLVNWSGQRLANEVVYTYLQNLPPGQKTCFDATFLNAPQGWSSYEFETPLFSGSFAQLPNLALLNSGASYDSTNGDYKLMGQVRNNQGSRVECVRLVGTLYNAAGKVIGCQLGYVSGYHLNAGQVGSFEILFYGHDYTDVATYQVQVEGHLP